MENLKSIQRLETTSSFQLKSFLKGLYAILREVFIFITASCRRPFDIASADDSRLNLYFQRRCRRAAHCNRRHFHRLHHRVLLVFALLSRVPPHASCAISSDDSGTKPGGGEGYEKLLEINHKKSRCVFSLNHQTNRLIGRLFGMVYLAFFIATSYGVKSERGGKMSRFKGGFSRHFLSLKWVFSFLHPGETTNVYH